MERPGLFIVAGPNGSGKSLFSKELTQVDLEVFDGDKHMSKLTVQFPETGSEALWSHINHHLFIEEKQKAIAAGINFAFETNFSNDEPLKSLHEFRATGYEIHLIFMGLNSIEESLQRVAYRVRTGGHKVSEESIRYNYEHGFKNLYKYFKQFDSVTLFDNSIAEISEPILPKEILHITGENLFLQTRTYPVWVRPIIDNFEPLKISYKE